MSKKEEQTEVSSVYQKKDFTREHAEFHNCYTLQSVKDDVAFLNMVYDANTGFTEESVTSDFINKLKVLGKEIYFFIASLEADVSPQNYIKHRYEFLRNRVPNGNPHLFYLAWNGLIKNDSFKRLLRQRFSLDAFNNQLCPKNIPAAGAMMTRYRNKLVLADDMAVNAKGKRRIEGRILEDGSGLLMREKIVWLPNGKAVPIFAQGYVPLNQTQVLLIRHGRSFHESGGDNPVFVGSGYWDHWENNRRISRSIGNYLQEEGVETAKELGRDFKVVVDTLTEQGYPLWSWSKDRLIPVFGSESENTEQTGRYFLQEAGYTNLSFNAVYGLNSQKYGALTHKNKKEIFTKTIKIYGKKWKGTDAQKMAKAKKFFKNRFFLFPEGETLIEADWRIAYSFVGLLRSNQGKRILLADHSGAIRVFAAIIKTLDFADYSGLKESHDAIIALTYQPGKNVRYDYIQRADYPLRKRSKKA